MERKPKFVGQSSRNRLGCRRPPRQSVCSPKSLCIMKTGNCAEPSFFTPGRRKLPKDCVLPVWKFHQIPKSHFVSGYKLLRMLFGAVDLAESVCYNAEVMICRLFPGLFFGDILYKTFRCSFIRIQAKEAIPFAKNKKHFWR